jgi:hypothetical protein
MVGDVRERLRELPAASVQCVVTSPPYWGLRDYGTARWEGGAANCDHVAPALGGTGKETISGGTANQHTTRTVQYRDTCGKCGAVRHDAQLGLERTPEEYVTNMVAVFREVRRVLRDDGTLWLNLGDSYARPQAQGSGRHPLAGRLRAPGGRLVSALGHHLGQAEPDAGVGDRPADQGARVPVPAHQEERYFYDADAVREPRSSSRASCGAPWERETEHVAGSPCRHGRRGTGRRSAVGRSGFFGSGTVGVVALKRGREAWGIELNPKYAQLARERIEGDAPLLNREIA